MQRNYVMKRYKTGCFPSLIEFSSNYLQRLLSCPYNLSRKQYERVQELEAEIKNKVWRFFGLRKPFSLEHCAESTKKNKADSFEQAQANDFLLENLHLDDQQLTNCLLSRSKRSPLNFYFSARNFHRSLENLPHWKYRPYGEALLEEGSIFYEPEFPSIDDMGIRRRNVKPKDLTSAQQELFVEFVKGMRIGIETYLCLNAPEAVLIGGPQVDINVSRSTMSDSEQPLGHTNATEILTEQHDSPDR